MFVLERVTNARQAAVLAKYSSFRAGATLPNILRLPLTFRFSPLQRHDIQPLSADALCAARVSEILARSTHLFSPFCLSRDSKAMAFALPVHFWGANGVDNG